MEVTRADGSRHRVLDRIVYWLFRLTIVLTRPLPLRLGYWVAARWRSCAIGRSSAGIARRCGRTWRACWRAMTPASLDAVARAVVPELRQVRHRLHPLPVDDAGRDAAAAAVRAVGELNEAADSGRGVIIATLHFGNWDLGAAALAAYGYPINAVAETFPYEPMNELVQGSRAKLGMSVHRRRPHGADRVPGVAPRRDAGDACGRCGGRGGHPAWTSSAHRRWSRRRPRGSRCARGRGWCRLSCCADRTTTSRSAPTIDMSLRDFAATGDEARDAAELTRLMHAGDGARDPGASGAVVHLPARCGRTRARDARFLPRPSLWKFYAMWFVIHTIGVMPLRYRYAISRFMSDRVYNWRSHDPREHPQQRAPRAGAGRERRGGRPRRRGSARATPGATTRTSSGWTAWTRRRSTSSDLDLRGLEYIQEAQARGHGVVMCSAHYGNPEFATQGLAGIGMHVFALVEPLKPPELDRLMRGLRLKARSSLRARELRGDQGRADSGCAAAVSSASSSTATSRSAGSNWSCAARRRSSRRARRTWRCARTRCCCRAG